MEVMRAKSGIRDRLKYLLYHALLESTCGAVQLVRATDAHNEAPQPLPVDQKRRLMH